MGGKEARPVGTTKSWGGPGHWYPKSEKKEGGRAREGKRREPENGEEEEGGEALQSREDERDDDETDDEEEKEDEIKGEEVDDDDANATEEETEVKLARSWSAAASRALSALKREWTG